jgi:hypothetical protein
MTSPSVVWTLIALMGVFDLVGLFYLWRRRQTQEAQTWRARNGSDAAISQPTLDRRRRERRSDRASPTGHQHRAPASRHKKTGT